MHKLGIFVYLCVIKQLKTLEAIAEFQMHSSDYFQQLPGYDFYDLKMLEVNSGYITQLFQLVGVVLSSLANG